MALPNLIVIGAAKCGTSSLHCYLDQHPEIAMSKEKEISFFATPDYFAKGVAWYESHFDSNAAVRGESSTNYTKQPQCTGMAERIHSLLPEVRLIYIVRNPIDRIVSHWIENYSHGRESRPFEKALANVNESHYVNCTRYAMQLRPYLDLYPRENLLILEQAKLLTEPEQTLRRVYRFLGVEENPAVSLDKIKVRQSIHKVRLNPVGKLISRIPPMLSRNLIRPVVPDWIRLRIRDSSKASIPRPEVPEKLYSMIKETLREDLREFREIADNKFPDWDM
jgi:hypothetical protein